MVLTEAFASGTPVVASDIAGYRDVVRDGVDGLLVPAGRRRSSSARRCARSRSTPRAAREMAAAARERAERFAWPRVASEVVEVYEEALEPCPRPRDRLARAARARPGSRPPSRARARRRERLPSLEPSRPRGGRRSGRRARRGACVVGGGPWPAPGSTALALERHRDRVDRPRAARRHAGLGARRLRADVRLDAAARRGLARDPARRAARHARAPPRRRARRR